MPIGFARLARIDADLADNLLHAGHHVRLRKRTKEAAPRFVSETGIDMIEAAFVCMPMPEYRRGLDLNEADCAATFSMALARNEIEISSKRAQGSGRAILQGSGRAILQGEATRAKLLEAEAAGFGRREMVSMLDFMRKETR